jgi:hypothetical protein
MPLFQEGRSRKAWRREVAAHIVGRLDREGEISFVGSRPEDRREMLRVAELLPDDVIAELYEDPYYPGMTFMEVRLVPEPIAYRSTKIVYPDGWKHEAV